MKKGASADLAMRNQPAPACKGNVLPAGVWCSRAGDDVPARSGHGARAKPDRPDGRDGPGHPWAPHHATARGPCPGPEVEPQEKHCSGGFRWLVSCGRVAGEWGRHEERAPLGDGVVGDAEPEPGCL